MLICMKYIHKLEICTGTGMAGIPRNPREIRGNGYNCCGNTAGMELRFAGMPRGWNLLSREIRGLCFENEQPYGF